MKAGPSIKYKDIHETLAQQPLSRRRLVPAPERSAHFCQPTIRLVCKTKTRTGLQLVGFAWLEWLRNEATLVHM